MKTILHIGSEKTGSTSIQTAMHQSGSVLRANGVYFPQWSDTRLRWHSSVPMLLGNNCIGSTFIDISRSGFDRLYRDVWHDWDRIEQDIHRVQPKVLVLSSEILFNRLDDQADRFISRLKALSSEIEIVAYLRSPDSFAKSWLLQVFKGGRFANSARLGPILDYGRVLEGYARRFDGNLRVFSYDADRAAYGSVVTPFFERMLGVTPPDQATRIFWNVTPSPDMLHITQRYFSRLYNRNSWQFVDADYQIMGKLLKLETELGGGKATYTDLARQWVDKNLPDVAALNREYGVGFPDHTAPTKPSVAKLPDQLALPDVFELDETRIAALHTRIEAEMPRFWASYGDSAGARLARSKIRFKRRARSLYAQHIARG